MPKNPTRLLVARVPVPTILGHEDFGYNHVDVEVSYDKGGINYFNYKTDPRGYSVVVRGLKVEPPTDGRFGSESFMMVTGPGYRVFLKPGERFNAKVLRELALKVAPVAETVADALAAGDQPASAAPLHELAAALHPGPAAASEVSGAES